MSLTLFWKTRRSKTHAEDSGEKATRRAFLAAAGAAGLCYTAALGVSHLPLSRFAN